MAIPEGQVQDIILKIGVALAPKQPGGQENSETCQKREEDKNEDR